MQLPEDITVECRIYIFRAGIAAGGEGLVKVLETIDKEGGLSAAARALGINYRRIWSRINSAERILGVKLVERSRGRRARLTSTGRALIRLYRRFQDRLKDCDIS